MKVIESQPVDFVTGGVLTPEDINDVFLYAKDAIDDVAERRLTEVPITFPFVTDVGAAYTQASGALLVHRFRCPVTCVIARAFLSANMTSAAEVTVSITKTSGGATPDGATTPWLSTGGAVASASVDTEDVAVEHVLLEADTDYSITVASSSTFTLERFDVTLHVVTDRFRTGATEDPPSFNPTLVTDEDARNATVVAANVSALGTARGKMQAYNAPAPALFIKHGLLSSTDADIIKWSLPRFASTRAQSVIKRIYLWAELSGAATLTVTATIRNAGGTSQATAVASIAAAAAGTGDSGVLSLAFATSGVSPATVGDDWTIDFANSSGATNALRVHALVWFARA